LKESAHEVRRRGDFSLRQFQGPGAHARTVYSVAHGPETRRNTRALFAEVSWGDGELSGGPTIAGSVLAMALGAVFHVNAPAQFKDVGGELRFRLRRLESLHHGGYGREIRLGELAPG
jgi:hypothetical protein